MKTIRFWHWAGAPVLIKLRAGDCLSHHHTTRHDEGWTRISHRWSFDGEVLQQVYSNDGRDCDGSHGYEQRSYITHEHVRAGIKDDGVEYPQWQDGGASAYDSYAEAMGY